MPSYNRVLLMGNLTRDPELRMTKDGTSVCSFGLAVNRTRSKRDEVDFFDVSAWRGLGETIANYKKKGDAVLIEGRLQYRTWEAQDGSKRSKVDVVADDVQFLYGNQESNQGPRQGQGAGQGQGQGRRGTARGEDVTISEQDFEDIPFKHVNTTSRITRGIL